jgi:hypothetical protein
MREARYRTERKSNIDFLEDQSIVLNTKTESMPAACEADIRLDRTSDYANARWNFRSHIGRTESPTPPLLDCQPVVLCKR